MKIVSVRVFVLFISLLLLQGQNLVLSQPCPSASPSPTPYNTDAKVNLMKIRNALAQFYNDTEGHYPTQLSQLVPKYLPSLPSCRTVEHGNQTGVQNFSQNVFLANGSLDRTKLTDSGKWGYVNNTGARDYGSVFVDCRHFDTSPYTTTDMKGTYANLGAIRTAVSIFYGDAEGVYPTSLSQLVPKYLAIMPIAFTCEHGRKQIETKYTKKPFGASQVIDNGTWGYVPSTGDVFVSCRHNNVFQK